MHAHASAYAPEGDGELRFEPGVDGRHVPYIGRVAAIELSSVRE